jgi:hypothetical protein
MDSDHPINAISKQFIETCDKFCQRKNQLKCKTVSPHIKIRIPSISLSLMMTV